MQDHKFEEIERRAIPAVLLDEIQRAEAAARVHQAVEDLVAEGTALRLTDEEQRLLRSFRAFKSRCTKPGEVFKWQTRPVEGVILAPEQVLITDPQEA